MTTASAPHKFEKEESECRMSLRGSGFGSATELITALQRKFALELIKHYEFEDIYFKAVDNRPGTTRVRIWTRYLLKDGTEKPQHAQIIASDPVIIVYSGISFKSGSKKSRLSFDGQEAAVEKLLGAGFSEWFRVRKSNGAHYEILGGDVERRVAIEDVLCTSGSSSWSDTMAEFEVLSDKKDDAVNAYRELLNVLGLDPSALIGEPMERIAMKHLQLRTG